jgi:hypothetical protein
MNRGAPNTTLNRTGEGRADAASAVRWGGGVSRAVFSVVDIVEALMQQRDYQVARNFSGVWWTKA